MPNSLFIPLLCLLLSVSVAAEPLDFVSASQQNLVELQLIGDGSKTSRTQLLVKNLGDKPLELRLAAGTVFKAEGRQSLALVKEKTLTLAPRKAAKTTQPTVCAGRPSEKPATATPTRYTPTVDAVFSERLARLQANTRAAKSGSNLPALPVPPALEVPVVVQLALWRELGYLTRARLKTEIAIQMELSQPTEEQDRELEAAVTNFWKATDLAVEGK